jgi:O-antigen/teichoic acid export membrane protein
MRKYLIFNFIVAFFNKGHERSVAIKKNVALSFVLKGISIILGFFQLPLTLHYLNQEKYGIWVTLSSIVGWFYYMDIGLGNGLRNKLAEALSLKNVEKAKIYISTAYALITMISLGFLMIFLIINNFIDWTLILNATTNLKSELNILVIIVFINFSATFILQIVKTILIADQKPAYTDFFTLIMTCLTLLGIIILTNVSKGSLIYLGLVYTVAPVITYLIGTFFLFSRKYRFLKPEIRKVKLNLAKDIIGLGLNFFVIQISAVIIYSTANIIITQLLGPKEVTPYNIAFKYFSIITMGYTILVTPFWSSFTNAYVKNDIPWIKMAIKKLNIISGGITILISIMIIISSKFFLVWIGDSVEIPFYLVLVMGINIIVMSWSTPYVFFLNGVGKIRLQLYVSLLCIVLFIPFAITLIKYFNLGIYGILLTNLSVNISAAILWYIQFNKIVNREEGIWQK